MKSNIFLFATIFALAIAQTAIASASCRVPGYALNLSQNETDHGWVKSGTTCRVNREILGGTRPIVFMQAAHGHVTARRSYWSYTPNKGFKGIDQFTIGIKGNDGEARRTIIMAVE